MRCADVYEQLHARFAGEVDVEQRASMARKASGRSSTSDA
jgi:hypothetical protein